MDTLIEFSIIIIIPVLIYLFQKTVYSDKIFNDEYYHIYLIKSIKENKNKFLTSHRHVFPYKDLYYPQLAHFIFSFISIEKLKTLSPNVPIIFTLLTNITCYIFLKLFIYLKIIEIDSNLIWPLILIVLTPFNYNTSNAKNIGFSARGLGLWFVYSALFLMVLFLNEYYYVYPLVIFATILIYLSSQFGTQFILFFSIIFGIITLNPMIIVMPFIAFLVFIIFNKKLALSSLKGQFGHKKNYYKHFAKVFILEQRFSIWRDLVFDIPRMLIKKEKNIKDLFLYTYSNNLINLIIGFPIIIFILYNSLSTSVQFDNTYLQISIVGCLIFIATSFRFSRFLGEPERYVEMILPFLPIYFIYSHQNDSSLKFILLGVSILIIIFDGFLLYMTKKKKASKIHDNLSWIFDITGDHIDTKIICNSESVNKVLVSNNKCQIFNNILHKEKIGSVEMGDLFTVYPVINPKIIPGLITEFKINYLLIDKTIINENELKYLLKNSDTFKENIQNDRFILLQTNY